MLKIRDFPEELPGTTPELLRLLDRVVPRVSLRPGDDPAQVLYQAGARDLVDGLIQRYELGRNPEEAVAENWYDYDPDLKSYIEETL